jgi:hypothetical protein
MLRSVGELVGYKAQATDGDAGAVVDLLFDDREWTVRYVVVDTEGESGSRRVLISTAAVSQPVWATHLFPLLLTQEQVADGPAFDSQQPISRQMEQEMATRFGWPPYWQEIRESAAVNVIERKIAQDAVSELAIRSIKEVRGYDIQATDGPIGRLDDIIADDQTWRIRYLVVHTGAWLRGRRVLVAPTWVDMVAWPERNISVGLTRALVENSPEFDPSVPVSAEYELTLYDYYGRPYDVM